jgi:predicted TIM-barrel fold metal-dependent hydrolase
MLIDIHTHASSSLGYSRHFGTRYPTPEELIDKMDSTGIEKAVLLCSVSPEVRYVLVTPFEVMEIAKKYPERIIPFCSIDPRMMKNRADSDFRPMLKFFKDSGCKGIGEYLPNIEIDHPLNMNLFSQIEEIGDMPIILHMAGTTNNQGEYGCYDDMGLPRLERVLQAFPNQIFIGHSHIFWSEITKDSPKRRVQASGEIIPGRVVELMRKYPNLHGDLSTNAGYNMIIRDLKFSTRFLEEFKDRLYWGSDFADPSMDIPQVDLFRKLKQEKLISDEAHRKITWENAVKLLNLRK